MHILWYVCFLNMSELCEWAIPNDKLQEEENYSKKDTALNSHPPYKIEFSCKVFSIIYQREKKRENRVIETTSGKLTSQVSNGILPTSNQ